jgi:lipopolysaccharide export system protein LptC
VSSDKLKITGGGEVVRFEGHVVMNIDKLPPPEATPEPAPPPVPVHPAKARPASTKSANSK